MLVGAALCIAVAWLLAGRHLDEPGLYYDEVIQAGPALDFLRGEERPLRIPGARSVRVGERWLPWMTQPYMGALKSLALIPVFAAVEPGPALLRATTLLWALLGIPFAMLFAWRVAGPATALVAGALLALDPSLLFLARHDWGSFALGFLLKCAGLFAIVSGLRERSAWRLALGGACLGLGVFNKIDFGVFVAGCGVAAAIAAPGEVLRRIRSERRLLAWLGAGFLVGALPLLLAGPGALSTAGAAVRGSGADELPMKWAAAARVLDGSYFERLLLAGGRFEDLPEVAGAGSGAGFAAFALALALAVGLALALRGGSRALLFFALTALLTLAGILATPRALRAHHFLNVLPFPQLVVAAVSVALWRRAVGGAALRIGARLLATLLVGATLVSSLRLDLATLELLRERGGRGLWSHAVEELARQLPAGTRVVSLDWGFDGPIRFVAPDATTEEPIWRLRRRGRPTTLEGGPEDLYLVHEPRYAVMPYGDAFLDALGRLPEAAVQVEIHRDRAGEAVLRSVRFARPHTLVYRGGVFEVTLR